MTSLAQRRRHLTRHTRGINKEERSRRDVWDRVGGSSFTGSLEPYTREDMWLDQMEALPTEEAVHQLVELLRTHELKQVTEGVVNDTVSASKMGDALEVAKAINSWIATAEELIGSRRRLRYILVARQNRR